MKVLAAVRLALVARSRPPQNQNELVQKMRSQCGCDERTAKHYLSSESWDLAKAAAAYKADKAAGLHASSQSAF